MFQLVLSDGVKSERAPLLHLHSIFKQTEKKINTKKHQHKVEYFLLFIKKKLEFFNTIIFLSGFVIIEKTNIFFN